jgi:hypothetical protein
MPWRPPSRRVKTQNHEQQDNPKLEKELLIGAQMAALASYDRGFTSQHGDSPSNRDPERDAKPETCQEE